MKIINKGADIPAIAKRWKALHMVEGSWLGEAGEVYEQLLQAKTVEDVERAIGNELWTKEWCELCELKYSKLVYVENCNGVINICLDCARKAVELLEGK